MMYNMKIKKKKFLCPYGEFFDIKSSNRKSIDDFDLFFYYNIIFKVKTQRPSVCGWLNSNSDHLQGTFIARAFFAFPCP